MGALSRAGFPLILCASFSGSVQAVSFDLGPLQGQFDSSLSIGVSYRMDELSLGNVSPGNQTGGMALSSTNDDGTLNFARHEPFSKIIKGLHDLELRYENSGLFTRFNYWYDMELEEGDRAHGHGPNGYASGELDDSDFSDRSKFSGASLLDAFLFHSTDVGDIPVDIRIGRQVVSWGESTFIQNSINAINPIDVSALRRPGAELKEALLPVNMVYGSFGLTQDLNLELFYQLEWEKTEIDACGTYFSTSDVAAEGCEILTVSPAAPDALLATTEAHLGGGHIRRLDDREPEDSGQFGISLRYYSPDLNDTEFGFFYINYHSRVPLVGVRRTADATSPVGFVPNYFIAFPEDIQLFGLSANTNIGEWAVSGEISHRIDMPVQINGSEVIGALLGVPNTFSSEIVLDEDTPGWDVFDVTQAQATFVRTFNRVAGASRLVVVNEVAFSYIHDDLEDHPYGRSTNYGAGSPKDPGFITQTAWGYRTRAALQYLNYYQGINLTPTLSWAHDVNGVSPTGGSFNEGARSVGLSFKGDYQERYEATVSYTRFFGGEFNTVTDRDFVSLSAAVKF